MAEQNRQMRFRALPLREAPMRVDRNERVIYGVSCAQAVEALGHGALLDQKTIRQIVDLGNMARAGVKSRFTHPGLSSDGLGKYLGRLRNFRVEHDKAVADLYLSETAAKSPSGNLAEYVMDLAEQEPDMFGMSVVIDAEMVWPLADGAEAPAHDFWEDNASGRPDNALTDKPAIRVVQLVACDMVDEPAANRDGLFSRALWASNQWAEQAFGEIDEALRQTGVSPRRAFEFALRYFAARGVDLKEFVMEQSEAISPAETPATEEQEEPKVGQEQAELLEAQLAQAQADLAREAEARAEALARVAELEGALDRVNARVAQMEADARQARFRALAAGWAGDPAGHVAILETLGEGSDLFDAYVRQQNAIAEQLAQSDLFRERGSSQAPATTAFDRLNAEANRLMAEDGGLTFAQAMVQAAERNPELYQAYVAEMRG